MSAFKTKMQMLLGYRMVMPKQKALMDKAIQALKDKDVQGSYNFFEAAVNAHIGGSSERESLERNWRSTSYSAK